MEEEQKLAEVVYRLSGASPGESPLVVECFMYEVQWSLFDMTWLLASAQFALCVIKT